MIPATRADLPSHYLGSVRGQVCILAVVFGLAKGALLMPARCRRGHATMDGPRGAASRGSGPGRQGRRCWMPRPWAQGERRTRWTLNPRSGASRGSDATLPPRAARRAGRMPTRRARPLGYRAMTAGTHQRSWGERPNRPLRPEKGKRKASPPPGRLLPRQARRPKGATWRWLVAMSSA